MKRRLISILVGVVLAFTTAAYALAAPISCPGNLTATHDGWYCASPSGNPTGAGWHNGTGDKI